MYVVVVADWLAHKGIGMLKPIIRAGSSPGHYLTLALFALSVIGLILSLTGKNYSQAQRSDSA